MSQITNIDSRTFGRSRAAPVIVPGGGQTQHRVTKRGVLQGYNLTKNLRGVDRVIAKDGARQILRAQKAAEA